MQQRESTRVGSTVNRLTNSSTKHSLAIPHPPVSTQVRSLNLGDDARRSRWPEDFRGRDLQLVKALVPYRLRKQCWTACDLIKEVGESRGRSTTPAETSGKFKKREERAELGGVSAEASHLSQLHSAGNSKCS